jgi:3-methyl-2-oxobutanoate hydroxymethyltransferase
MYTQLEQRGAPRPPVNMSSLHKMKAAGEKIAWLTAYDASFAMLVDMAGVDVVLVGDSLGMVIQGHETTVPVTMDDIVYHSRYATRDQALGNAVRLMQDGGAKMVKLESGAGQLGIVEFLASHDIPLCAHIGLRPQSVHKVGGFRVQGREAEAAEQMLRDAKDLQNAGADIVLLECVPAALGAAITEALDVPVIGIGAGPDVDGQVLVLYDILDLTPGRKPRFTRNFMEGAASPLAALEAYVRAVKDGSYPASEHCF